MKERPILFSAPMVRAILEGRKTQTRRIISEQKYSLRDLANPLASNVRSVDVGIAFEWLGGSGHIPIPCPYGKPGDRLWVREACRIAAWREKEGKFAFDYKASPELTSTPWTYPPDDGSFDRLLDRVTNQLSDRGVQPDEHGVYRWERGHSPCPWKPSIHMHRWASRILLEITDVRVQRLLEISKEDSISEGIESCESTAASWAPYLYKDYHLSNPDDSAEWWADPRESFRTLWNSINGEGAWSANPWVWAITFKRIEAVERAA